MGTGFPTWREFREDFPWKTMMWLLAGWLVLAAVNLWFILYSQYPGTDWFFPISVIYPGHFMWTGFVYGFAFLALGIFCWKYLQRFPLSGLLLACIFLILLGNMAQGDFDKAFLQPFYWKGQQYYNDALRVTDGKDFLRTFHQKQEVYLLHTRTHPPFVVLLHYWLLRRPLGGIRTLAVVFFLLSMLIFLILLRVFRNIGFSAAQIRRCLLLFAILPSVNIYTLVSIDGLVAVAVSLGLLSVTEIYRKNKVTFLSVLFGLLSITLSNMLSFSGLFIIAFLGLISAYFLWQRQPKYAVNGMLALALSVLIFLGFYQIWGYDHYAVFRTASTSENPNGFLLFYNPFVYFSTRLQDIGEILLFLSFPLISLIFNRERRLGFCPKNIARICGGAGIAILLLMFLTGAYGTGETARACLFIVPFIFIFFTQFPPKTYNILFLLCLLQTAGMQMVGNFFW